MHRIEGDDRARAGADFGVDQLAVEAARQRHDDPCAEAGALDLSFATPPDPVILDRQFGHPLGRLGDQALRHFAGILSSQLRKTDTAGRLGGEEFAVVLSDANLDKAMHFATRIQNQLASTPIQHAGEQIYLAVSVGISSLNASDASVEAALSRSDIALYCAKRGGRNRIEHH